MMQEIKVIHTEWSGGWGGQEIRIINESLAIKQKYAVKIFIACKEDSQISIKARQAGLEVVHFDFKSSFDLKTIFALVKFIKQNGISILNSHSGKDTWVGGIAAKIAGIKFIRTRHLSNPINPSRLNFINSLADFIITTGSGVREAMIRDNRIKKDKISSIPTGIDDKEFDPNIYNKNECKELFGFEKDKIYIGMLGVLRSVKRCDLFLDIALKLHDDFKDIRFVIAGDGPQREKLQNFIDKNGMNGYARLLGHTKDSAKFLKAIDIFMLTSQNEGVPQALIQALLMQKACIATNVGSVKDLYDGSNFCLSDFDKDILALNLTSILKDNTKKEKFQTNARDFVKFHFTKDIMAQKIYKIYMDLLSGGSNN
ncbi:glycosyltransferase [Campylobacter curvus]|uniref:glycosyltransferase n=1 Tax=Campylobacter curvus TaxID=200 RepID=UPI000381AD7E|nr:glycosyltransferase [Campylobacter curvus]QKF60700.1 glycosyltransferase, family 1 [Campylobacter curvus]UEB49026.1 glycosyltransferase [Campylobacter curvus]